MLPQAVLELLEAGDPNWVLQEAYLSQQVPAAPPAANEGDSTEQAAATAAAGPAASDSAAASQHSDAEGPGMAAHGDAPAPGVEAGAAGPGTTNRCRDYLLQLKQHLAGGTSQHPPKLPEGMLGVVLRGAANALQTTVYLADPGALVPEMWVYPQWPGGLAVKPVV